MLHILYGRSNVEDGRNHRKAVHGVSEHRTVRKRNQTDCCQNFDFGNQTDDKIMFLFGKRKKSEVEDDCKYMDCNQKLVFQNRKIYQGNYMNNRKGNTDITEFPPVGKDFFAGRKVLYASVYSFNEIKHYYLLKAGFI